MVKEKPKHIVLSEKTRVLFNQVKGLILLKNPDVENLTDDKVVNTALKKFKEAGKK